MTRIWLGLVVAVVFAGVTVAGCGQSAQNETQEGVDLTQAVSQVDQAAQQAKAEAEKAAQQAKMEAEKAAQQAKADAEARAAKINDLLAKAQQLLDSGELQKAINQAQVVLNQYDPNSSVAQNIIKTARAQLEKMAEDKAQEVTSGVQGVLEGMGQ